MPNKTTRYGLGTKSEIDAVTVGSGTYTQKDHLTYDVVTTAIRNYKNDHPNFDDLSPQIAAQKIANKLKDDGFQGVRASNNSITDGTISITLTRANNDNGQIVAKLPKDKKK